MIESLWIQLLFFIAIGIAAGFLAGLFGLGGGIIVVPALVFMYTHVDIPDHVRMQFAEGTSLAVTVCTALSAMIAHYRRGSVLWVVFRRMVPCMMIGVVAGAVSAHYIHSQWLMILFGLFLLFVALRMMLKRSVDDAETMPEVPFRVVGPAGGGIGFVSGLLGIGGGSMSVPFLHACSVSMRRAVGTSASMTLPIAVVGALTYMFMGSGVKDAAWSTGYVYWPAVISIAPLSVCCAPLGAALSHRLPERMLRRLFACLLVIVGIKMLWP